MSRQAVEVVRRIYEATARRDRETVLSLYHPDAEWDISRHPYGEVFEGRGSRVGRESIRAWFHEWYEAFEDFEHECDELIDAGEHVVSVGTDHARGRVSGVQVQSHLAGAWTVREGKVVRVAWFPSREEALEAARLRE
jgi:uncharacterized protein